MRDQFEGEIPNVIEIPWCYSNAIRRDVINFTLRKLLDRYDYILRCDVDEFIVPDPHVYEDLADYIDRIELPYVTALGLDVAEMSYEPELNLYSSELLNQRSFVVKTASYSKTCLTATPINWSQGFHFSDVSPMFNHLYLFHMKFSDIKGRISWLRSMSDCSNKLTRDDQHFKRKIGELEHLNSLIQTFQVRSGPDAIHETSYQSRIEASSTPPTDDNTFFWHLEGTEGILSEITDGFRKAF